MVEEKVFFQDPKCLSGCSYDLTNLLCPRLINNLCLLVTYCLPFWRNCDGSKNNRSAKLLQERVIAV